MKVLLSIVLTLGALLAFPATSSGWDTDGLGIWPDGRLRLRLHLRGSPTYSDGSRPNTVAIAATEIWNRNMERLEFTTEINDNRQGSLGNGVNDVYFDSEVQNEPFDEFTLAVTMIRSDGPVRLETDVVVNSEENWDSYRGPFNYDRPELRRVLLHEFGHVLGLDHPDEAGQFVDALMNSAVSDIDTLAYDDQEGIASLYGRGESNPANAPVLAPFLPADTSTYVGERTVLLVEVSAGSKPLTYEWRKDGAPISGAIHSSYQIFPTTMNDAGGYSVVVTNEAGSVVSRNAVLTVTEVDRPTITQQPTNETAIVGMGAGFRINVYSVGTITYQWFKNGEAITGANSQNYGIYSVSESDAGSYHVVVSNAGGSVTSATATLTVSPVPPPPLAELGNVTVWLGDSFDLSIPSSTDNQPKFYQWYHDGSAIPGATNISYHVPRAAVSHGGEYFVVVTNPSGSTASRTALVTVEQSIETPVGGWIDAIRSGNTVYFLFENPARVERFDLASGSFLLAIGLPNTPTAFCTAGSSLIVAFGRAVSKFDLEEMNQVPLFNAGGDVRSLFSYGNLLFSNQDTASSGNGVVTSFDLQQLQTIDTVDTRYDLNQGFSITPDGTTIVARSAGISPSNISRLEVNPDGMFGVGDDSPYDGDFPGASRTFMFPDGSRVVDNSGTIYTTATLEFVGLLGTPFQDVLFLPDGRAVTLRSGSLFLYDNSLAPSGRVRSSFSASRIFAYGNEIIAFSHPNGGGTGIDYRRFPVSEFSAPSVRPIVDPTDLNYSPDTIILDADNNLLLYSKVHQNIFRWSPKTRTYLESIPLTEAPNFLAYDKEANRLYLGYADTSIREIDLGSGMDEKPFTTAPQGILNMAMAGDYLFLVDPSGSWEGYYVYDRNGSLVSSRDGSWTSRVFAWNESRRRLYHFRDRTSPNDLIYTEILANGEFGTSFDSPYHGDIEIEPPIAISPSGDQVLLGTGVFYNADTLTQSNSLSNSINGCAWIGDALFTIRGTIGGDSEVQRWGGNDYLLNDSAILSGYPYGLFAVATNRLVAVTLKSGHTHFTMLDADLNARVRMDESNVAPNSRMLGISTRAEINATEPVVIAGFSVTGTGTKRILVRAIGPSLANHGLTGVLSDPTLAIVPLGGSVIAENDNWSSENEAELMEAFENVFAFPIASETADAALILDVAPGSYTAVVSGADGGTGIVLVEVYDMDQTAGTARLAGISTRGYVGTGSSILIPGVAIAGPEPAHLLVRVVGPGLIQHSVQGVLSDPQVVVTTLQGAVISGNNDWGLGNSFETASISAQSHAFPIEEGSPDAAFVLTLQPGTYTFQASGVALETGVALVEVYELK